jgi:uncharacterized protein (DUF697 family)
MHDIDRTQMESFEAFEFAGETGVFSESEETELAAELLEIGNESELDHFLGNLISKAGSALGQFVASPTGQALGGLLKGAAKKVLPMAGQAIGGYVGGATGAQIGQRLGSAASGLFETEDRELDAARGFVRLAGDAVRNALVASPTAGPQAVAHEAMARAASRHAPGLMSSSRSLGSSPGYDTMDNGSSRARSGRWLRRGGRIILYGV